MSSDSSNKTIVKNTAFLYFRMLFTMIVSLYTSRVVLQYLGVEDFGIYQSVGGFVALIAFVNGALATGTSRILTFELGKENKERLKDTFSTVLLVHVILALLVIILAETIGLWFLKNKLIIPEERTFSSIIVFHVSVLTLLFSIIQIPYSASIISHEKMSVYAYMSIIEVTLKLAIVYLLSIGNFDKLIFYSILLCVVQIVLSLTYSFYCIHKFSETHLHFSFDKDILRDVLSYSGWSLFSSTATSLSNQGAVVLINMFFSPGIVAARAIANQVNSAASQFVNNFRTAANPQIVKRYAASDFEGSKSLLLNSTKFSFFIMLILSLPICLVAEPLLKLWLGVVPEYSVPFVQLAIITSLFEVLDTSFYTALYAKGQIKENALISPTILFLGFPISYVLFKFSFSPLALAWVYLIIRIVLGTIIKPLLLIKIVNYKWNDFYTVFIPCLKVLITSLPIPLISFFYKDILFCNQIVSFIMLAIIGIISVTLSSWYIGLDRDLRIKGKGIFLDKIKKKR